MPTVLRVDGYRFFFFSNEGNESPNIHVQQAERYAKYWLQPLQLASSPDYSRAMSPQNRLACRDEQNGRTDGRMAINAISKH